MALAPLYALEALVAPCPRARGGHAWQHPHVDEQRRLCAALRPGAMLVSDVVSSGVPLPDAAGLRLVPKRLESGAGRVGAAVSLSASASRAAPVGRLIKRPGCAVLRTSRLRSCMAVDCRAFLAPHARQHVSLCLVTQGCRSLEGRLFLGDPGRQAHRRPSLACLFHPGSPQPSACLHRRSIVVSRHRTLGGVERAVPSLEHQALLRGSLDGFHGAPRAPARP